MGYKTKVDLVTDKTIQLGGKNAQGGANPKSIEGYYLGAKDTNSEYGPGKLHIFQTSEGNVGVWGKTNLNRIMTGEHIGQMCLVSFTGMGAAKKGRRPAYNYELKYDEDNTISVANINLQTAGEEVASEYDGADDEGDVGVFEEEAPADEIPVARPVARKAVGTTPTAEAIARAQQRLLGTNRKAS